MHENFQILLDFRVNFAKTSKQIQLALEWDFAWMALRYIGMGLGPLQNKDISSATLPRSW